VASQEALVARVSVLPLVAAAIAVVAFNAMTATRDRPVVSDRLWRVERFAEWADIPVKSVYYQIDLGRIPGVVRFGKTVRIDPEVAIPALREAAAR
jgi:hypothetical protein